jgi:MYXO-CTERM domain-containing protein
MVGRSVVACVVLAVLAGSEGRAEACSPLPDLAFEPWITDGAVTGVPTDGVIAFQAGAYGDLDTAVGLMSITVTSDGAEVPGTIETVDVREASSSHQLFVVWRPDGGFAAASSYTATIAVLSQPDAIAPGIEIVLDVTTADGPAGTLPSPLLADVELAASATETGDRVCCDENSCGATCVGVDLFDRPMLSAALGLDDDPLLSQVYLRTLAGPSAEALEPDAVIEVASRIGDIALQRVFEAPDDAYCIAVEVVSFIDGGVSAPIVVCEDHGELVLGGGPNPNIDAFVEGCAAPYWEETQEPYVPDGDTDGGVEGGSGSEGGGAEESSGGAEAGQLEGSSGNACAVGGGRSPWSGALMLLAIAGLVRRRARR